MTALRALSFDLDGTLVDTAGEIAAAANLALREHRLLQQDPRDVGLLIGHGSAALMRSLQAQAQPLAPGMAVPDADTLIASFDRHYKALIGRTSRAYPGAAAALARLKSGGIRLACTTNKNLEFAQALLDTHGLGAQLDLVVGGDSLPFRKPDGRVLQHVAAALGVQLQELAHVGDSATDIKSARAAGVHAWGVPWGYNGGTPIEASAPDAVFPSLLAVAAHVLAVGTAAAVPAPT